MPITRARAQVLLNATEMRLYDDSRANPLRRLDAAMLKTRIERTRRARERARDLVRRQKLASRAATGSKRGRSGLANQRSKDKAALLDDILKRFEGAARTAAKAGSATKAAAARTGRTTTKTTAGSPRRATVPEQAASGGRKVVAAPARQPPTRKQVAARKRLAAIRAQKKLLEEKTGHDREPRPWQALDATAAPAAGTPGFQSASAAGKAGRLHAGESRMKPIHGSASTRDRRNQGKRDSRHSVG